MYRVSLSWKLATMVVMKGCPATAASTFLSFRTCSTCFSRITSVFLRIFNAKTLLLSRSFRFAIFASHTRANVPVPSVLMRSKSSLRSSFDECPTGFSFGSFATS